jgi:hypothetical protein
VVPVSVESPVSVAESVSLVVEVEVPVQESVVLESVDWVSLALQSGVGPA